MSLEFLHLDFIALGVAHAALGGTLLLTIGLVAAFFCRQPIHRIRLIELTLGAALALPILSQIAWLPHWSVGTILSTPPALVERHASPAALSTTAPVSPMAIEPSAVGDSGSSILTESDSGPDRAVAATETSQWTPLELLVAGYGLGLIAIAVLYSIGLSRVLRLYRSTTPVPSHVREAFREIAGPAHARVILRASDSVGMPIALRGWRPVIVLPTSLSSGDDDSGLRFSLAHEWSHIEGGDVTRWYWTSLVQFLYFFHPLCWQLRRQLRLSQDFLADARAAEQAEHPSDYAQYLVGLARLRMRPTAAALGIGDSRSNLHQRVVTLLQPDSRLLRRCFGQWTIGAAVAGLGVLFLCSSLRLNARDSVQSESPKAETAAAPADKKADPFAGASISKDKIDTLHYTGKVVEKGTGKVIAGATVTVRRSILGDPQVASRNPIMEETKHVTDADGKYSFTIPPDQTAKRYLYIELDVEHPEYAPQSHFGYALSMILKNEKVGSRPFFELVEMRAGKAITGTMRTGDGQPVVGAKVQAYSVTNNRAERFEYGSFTDCKTDSEGRFRLVVTTPGTAVFWLMPDKQAPSLHRVPEEKRGDLGTFTVEPGIAIKGKVLDVRGKPMANLIVNARNNDRGDQLEGLMVGNMMSRSAKTDEHGEFEMKPLPAGEYDLTPSERSEDGSGAADKEQPVPAVFMRQRLKLTKDTPSVEIRAVPHVVIEAQYYDSKGKKSRGHAAHLFGQLGKASWFGEAKVSADGQMTLMVPHGLEKARMSLMTNEHGALRFRTKKGDPLAAGREIDLGTLNDDVRDIEIVHYKAPMLVIGAIGPDKQRIKDFKPQVDYESGVNRMRKGEQFVNGLRGDVFLEKQEDGRYHTSQLLPDEAMTITVHADNYESKSLKLSLPEGEVREVDLVLEAKAEKKQ